MTYLCPLSSLFGIFLLATTSLQAESKPNFVFILVDDLGKEDMGIEGSTFYETPHIDSLGKRSLRFERGYSACQVCSPSRAAIQSGKTPARVGITDYISVSRGNQPEKWKRNTKLLPAEYNSELALDEVTIAEAMKESGYRTFFAGKWHLGRKGSRLRSRATRSTRAAFIGALLQEAITLPTTIRS